MTIQRHRSSGVTERRETTIIEASASPAVHLDQVSPARQLFLHRVVLLYTHLWILEGAFRKWVPGTDEIMYIARDGALLLAIVYVALKYPSRDRSKWSALFWLAVVVVTAWSFAGALIETTPPLAVVVGMRAYIAPLLLIYVVWRNQLKTAWRGIARIIVIYAPIETALVVTQVLSPLSSPVNAYAGGAEGTFVTADGVARATGTFTFSAGLTLYVALAVAVVLGCVFTRFRVINMPIVMVSLISCIVMVAISGSRGLVLNAALVASILLVGQLKFMRGRELGLVAVIAAIGWLTWVGIQNLLAEALAAFQARVELAAAAEDPYARVVRGAFGFLITPFPLLGPGAGAHSQAGIVAGSALGWVESDPLRPVMELGSVGYAIAVLRLLVGLALVVAALVNSRRVDPLSTSLAAVVGLQLVIGNITATPSAQGAFGIAAAALLSLNYFERAGVDDQNGSNNTRRKAPRQVTIRASTSFTTSNGPKGRKVG